MPVISAGILLYRRRTALPEVLLVHPGGPYWASKELGAWSVPKGILASGEDPYEGARREFLEETGFDIRADKDARDLGPFRQSSSKILRIWAVEGDWNPQSLISNTFDLEWPPKSGRIHKFPEVDRAEWCDQATAELRIVKGQRQVLDAFYGGY
jgi:predicted NUDIX family NTP pyrophosphohydrolase